MAAESTAVNALIHLVQARRLDSDEDPVPDLFSTAPPKSIAQRTIGMPADPRPMAPAVVPPAPPRVASGTKPPPIAEAKTIVPHAGVPIQPPLPSKPAVVQHDDEQTALWDSNAQVETAPAVPAIAPHIATVIAQPAVPSILRGPVAPAPDPRVMEAARAAHAAAQRGEPVSPRHGRPATDPRVDAAAAARAAQQRMPVAAHPVSLSPQYPARAYAVGGGSIHVSNPHLPHIPRTPTAAPAPYLVARELMTSAVRSWGTLVVVCVLALGVGAYLAIASKGDDKPEAPTDRDRAIAIMNGTAQPETVVAAPSVVTAPEVTTAYTSLDETTAEPAKPTAEPIEDAETEDDDATDEIEIDVAAIEIETDTPTAKPAKKRAARSARAARKAKSIASKQVDKPTRGDPVLAILAEKPKAARAEKKQAEPKKTKVKEASLANATEIAAARGAAPTKGTGKVAISSDKPALIFVDGRPTGKSAPSAFVMPAGDHQITLLDPATKKAKTATVQIAANKTVSIRKDFN